MKNNLTQILVLFSLVFFVNCTNNELKNNFVEENYTKEEVTIRMRDGINLHTTIYSPKDKSVSYPILLMRTPYSCSPYGKEKMKTNIGPNINLMKEGNIMWVFFSCKKRGISFV